MQQYDRKRHATRGSQSAAGNQGVSHTVQLQRRVGNQAVSQLMQAMPDNLKAGVQRHSGLSMDQVKVHYNSSNPGQLGAAAYAQGTDIYLGPGQEKHLPHEAWHVVQQAQGRVRPTVQMKHMAVNDDAELEKEADEMGSKLLQANVNETPRLKSMDGTQSTVKQLARLENASPLLANGRDLMGDAETLLMGTKRAGIDAENLLDTTYDNMGENLLLDINMLFEENLQRAIEHDGFFTNAMKEIVEIIHKQMNIQSVDQASVGDEDKDLKKERTEFILRYISEKLGERVSVESMKENNWNLDTSNVMDPEDKRMTTGYGKLLKMLETQLPYFGGSEEYDKNERDKLEYWIYHMSTLTKDPDRQYAADSPKSKLVKPMMDYRTREGGLVPHQNQRNLGTGIVELQWDELAPSLRSLILQKQSGLYDVSQSALPTPKSKDKSARLELLDKLYEKYTITDEVRSKALISLWGKANEDDRKMIYGDILMLPWSDAHIKKTKDRTPENVAGVMGNILESPNKAKARYEVDLERYEDTEEDLNKFNHVGSEVELTKEMILQEFEDKHKDWYEKSKANHKPIIGGMSGHTLGYLNVYEEALAAAELKSESDEQVARERQEYPSMEVLRANMLGALIGDKRHHSYDEVMSASHNMPTHDDQQKLQYKFPDSYKDVLQTEAAQIQTAAASAKDETKESVNNPESNTILHMLTSKVYQDENNDALNELKGDLRNYLDDDLKHNGSEYTQKITSSVNELIKPQERNLDESRLTPFIGTGETVVTSTPLETNKLDEDRLAPFTGERVIEERPQRVVGKLDSSKFAPFNKTL